MKKGIFIVFIICYCMFGNAYTAHASEVKVTTWKGVQYHYRTTNKSSNSVEIVRIKNAPAKLIIPSRLDGHRVYGTTVTEDDTEPFISYADAKRPTVQIKVGNKNHTLPVLKSIVINEGVRRIGEETFWGVQSEKITIPKSVKEIGYYGFCNNVCVKKINFRNPQINIGKNAFQNCSRLSEIMWSQKQFRGKIESDAFSNCGLKELKLPYMKDMGRQIKLHSFAGNENLRRISFDKRMKNIEIGNEWFTDCKKAMIVVGKNVKTFASKVNTHVKTVQLLGVNTKLKGFTKIVKEVSGPNKGTYVKTDNPVIKKFRYYIQYKKFIVPKKARALRVLKKAYYGVEKINAEDLYDSEENSYYGTNKLKKVVVKKR